MTNQDIYKQAKKWWRLYNFVGYPNTFANWFFGALAMIYTPFFSSGCANVIFNHGTFFYLGGDFKCFSSIVFLYVFIPVCIVAYIVVSMFGDYIRNLLDKPLIKLFDQLTFSDDDIQEAITELDSRQYIVWYRRADQLTLTEVEMVRGYINGDYGDFKQLKNCFAHSYFNDVYINGGGQRSALDRFVWNVKRYCTSEFCRRYDAETLRQIYIECANQFRSEGNELVVQAIISHLEKLDFEMDYMHVITKFGGVQGCIEKIIANCEKKTIPYVRYLKNGKNAIDYDVMVGDQFSNFFDSVSKYYRDGNSFYLLKQFMIG